MSRKKRQNKLLRKKYLITSEELIKQGKLEPYFHLKDPIDMKEEQLKNKTDWWKKMSEPPKGVGVFSCKPIQTFVYKSELISFVVEVRFLRLGKTF
jgi:hypothetical protein